MLPLRLQWRINPLCLYLLMKKIMLTLILGKFLNNVIIMTCLIRFHALWIKFVCNPAPVSFD